MTTQAYLAAIVESSDDAIISKDLNGTITSWNSGAERIFGFTSEEAIGRHIGLIIPTERMNEEGVIIARIKNGERVDHFETQRQAKDGHLIDLSITISPIRNASGEIIGASKTARDISLQKSMVAELERSNQELEKFAHIAAHDLKSPLRGIDNLASWIMEDNKDALPKEAQDMLTMLRTRVKRLEKFLDDILTYSRAGHAEDNIAEVNLNEMIAEIAQMQVPEGFSVRVPQPLPTLTCLATPFRQAFSNLISNAVKHHDRGQGVIEVRMNPSGPFYEFIVADDGPGIPPEDQERVFQMFQTLRPRDQVEGSGMGLAIVRKLVESQGGKAWVKSEKGQRGTEVHFLWPAKQPAKTEPQKKLNSSTGG